MKFESKKKKAEITIDGTSYEMRMPTIRDSELLEAKLKDCDSKDVIKTYQNFFEGLGLPIEAQKEMDSGDFLEFISAVINPKKNSPTGT